MLMTETVHPSGEIQHRLKPFFAQLGRFHSTPALKRSSLFASLESEIERVLASVAEETFAGEEGQAAALSIRAVAWNIERGTNLEGILEAFRTHAALQGSDLLLLTEVDLGMARTGNRHIAREIGSALGYNYAFAPCYIALNKGSGLESAVSGENEQALHGNALFSRHPLLEAHSLAIPNGKDLMWGKEKRLGSQRAVIATIDHPTGAFRAVSLHLDAHSSQRHRWRQMRIVLDHLESLRPALPVLIGGDWNTSTYDSSRASYTILGYCRRVLMGVRNVLQNHYPYPDRWFERHIFRGLEKRGYEYRSLNEPGACTLHYNIDDLAANHRMADWIPQWCFWFINWALQKNDGRCSIKLDWFAGKGISPDAEDPPRVAGEVHEERAFLSDHDPIVLTFRLESR